jgi:hypothetical protein
MLWLLVSLVLMFALFAVAFRRSLMHWMKVGYQKDKAATDLMASDALTPEEKMKLRDRYKQQITGGN